MQNWQPPGNGYPPAPQGYGAPPQGYGYPAPAPAAPQGYGQPYGAPPGGPPQGYGAPPGAPPQGYGQPPMGGGFDPFSKAGHVAPSSNLPRLGVGDGRVIVENVKLVNGQNGMFWIAEVYVLGFSNAQNPAGSRACFMPKVSGQYADSGLADAISCVAACLGMQTSDPRAKTLGGNSPEEARATMLRTVAPEQPLRGHVVDVTVFGKPMRSKPGGDPFMKHTWRPVLDAQGLPAKAAIPQGQAPSAGQPAPQGYGAPPGYQAPNPAPVGFGYPGAGAPTPPPQVASQGPPPGEWFDFPQGDPRHGREVYNRAGQTRAK